MHGGCRAGCSGRSTPPRTTQSLDEGHSPTACKVNQSITLGIDRFFKKYLHLWCCCSHASPTLRFCSRVLRHCLLSACV